MSDICKNCGKPKGKHVWLNGNCPLPDGRGFYIDQIFEPLTTPTFTADGEIKGEVFEGFEIDAEVDYPNMWLYLIRAMRDGCDFSEKGYLSDYFYACAITYLETKYATQIEAFGERKRKEAES